MPITFDKITQIWQNLHFWIALVKTFRMMYNLTGFSDIRTFPLFLAMTSLWRHFLSHGFQISISVVELTKDYQPAKFQWCKLSGSSFTEGLQKRNEDVIMTSLHIFEIRNSHVLWNWLSAIKLTSFRSLSYLNQILERLVQDTPKATMTSLWRHFTIFSFQNCTFCRT